MDRMMMFVVLQLLAVLAVTSSTQPSPGFNDEALSVMIETSHRCRKKTNPGLAVSVVKDGVTLLSRGYGVTRPHGNTRVTSETRFNVASLTKAFAAALLVKVMDDSGRFYQTYGPYEGMRRQQAYFDRMYQDFDRYDYDRRYNLSTKVRDILGPNFRFEDDLRTQHATVEDLLSHKMAIPGNSRIRFNPAVTRRSIGHLLRYLKSYDTFRNTFIYSNIMYGLASRMAEIVGQGRWEDLIRRHFLRPLEMFRSTFSTEANYSETHTAKPYVLYKGNLEPVSYELPRRYSELVGSGAFITTANDMVKWMNFHLSDGVSANGQRLMKKESMEELHRPRTAMPESSMRLFRQPDIPVTTSFDIYALGWWRGYYRGYPILGHSGASYGYRAFVVLIPSLKAGVFLSMTGDDKGYTYRGTLLNLILDHLLGVTPWVDTNILCTFPSPWHNVSSAPSPPYDTGRPLAHNISAYLGFYEHPAYGQIQIKLLDRRTGRRGSLRNKGPPRLTLLFGFARWDLVPLRPKYAALNSKVSARTVFPEYFYGVGKGVNAFIDYTPFIFLPPEAGKDVIEEISAPAFEKRLPPIFKRVTTSGSSSLSTVFVHHSGHMLLSFILCMLLVR